MSHTDNKDWMYVTKVGKNRDILVTRRKISSFLVKFACEKLPALD